MFIFQPHVHQLSTAPQAKGALDPVFLPQIALTANVWAEHKKTYKMTCKYS